MRFIRVMLFALPACSSSLPMSAQPKWDVTNTVHIGGEGAWDYVTVDLKTTGCLSRAARTPGDRRRNRQGGGRHSGADSVPWHGDCSR